MEWTDETIARLKALWAEGHSTAEIGRRMSVSKNAVVGKAHRLNLEARPSPIRRDGGGTPARAPSLRRMTGPTLPSMAGAQSAVVFVDAPPSRVAPATPADVFPASAAAPAPPPIKVAEPVAIRPQVVRVVAARVARTVTCCWPIGEPGTKSFRFCDAAAANNKPYCTEHAAVAYVKVRDRREEAA